MLKKSIVPSSSQSFTLIELLVVIAILAALSVGVVLVIKPQEMIAQARDTRRLTDLQNINKALGILIADNYNAYLGDPNTVYTSLIDPNSTTCSSLGLPSLPPSYQYHCSTSTDIAQKVDGTGWIPVNFTQVSMGLPPLSKLPLDPINNTSTGEYYTYIPGGSYELTAQLTSLKQIKQMKNDGGIDPALFELGSNMKIPNLGRGLVGYWTFDEGSGTTAYDYSGYGNNGNWMGSGIHWSSTNKKVGNYAGQFNGNDDYVTFASSSALINAFRNSNTVSLWYYYNANDTTTIRNLFTFDATDTTVGRERSSLTTTPNKAQFDYSGSDNDIKAYQYSTFPQSWHHLVIVINTDIMKAKIYHDDTFLAEITLSTKWAGSDSVRRIGYAYIAQYLNGYIDDVRIYNRALSEAEIKAIYNATK